MSNFSPEDTEESGRQSMYVGKIHLNHKSYKGFVFIVYKELSKHNYKKTNNQFEKR